MSWWVNDYIAVSEDETQQLCNIQADAVSDLPAQDQTATAGFIFVRGSKAYVLETSGQYIMNSSGQWVLQKSGQEIEISADDIIYDNTDSEMTATNVQDAIDEIKDLDDMQDRALSELYGENANQQLEINYAINTGAKNLLKITASSGTLNTATIDIADDGSLHITGQPTANGAYVISSGIELIIPENSYILSVGAEAGSTKMALSLRIKGTTQYVDLYRAESLIIPEGTYDRVHIYLYADTVYDTYVYPMIRKDVIRNSTFEPYAPTNRELYELCETKASLNDIYGLKPTISNGTDLNNITAGCMTCPGATVAASLLNCPTTTDAFIIYTDYLAATSRAIQRIYSFSTTTGIPSQYMRVRWSQGWTPWYQVMMQSVASVQSVNPVSTLNLSRNDLDESLDTEFEPLDSITEEEEGEIE